MERRHHNNTDARPEAPPRRAQSDRKQAGASFSASLLDAIYRSLDDGKDGSGAEVNSTVPSQKEATAPTQFCGAKDVAKQKPAATAEKRRHERASGRPRHSGYASSTSSDSSSSHGFSCSSSSTTDTEPVSRRRQPTPQRQPEAAAAAAATSPHSKAKKNRRPCLPGARLRRRSGPSSPPPSPATFAGLLKALFTSARLPRKPKTPPAAAPPMISPSPPPPRPCMPTSAEKAPAVPEAAERRSVRFCTDVEAAVVRRRVEELARSLREVEEDNDEGGEEGSDASSDLFELESLRGADGDELPVYGTTSLAANRAIAQGAAC